MIRILLIALIASSGCARDIANRYYDQERYAPKEVNQVLVLTSKPNQAFKVIADFQSRGESAEDLRKKAAEIGADAIIVTTLGGYYNKSDWAEKDLSNSYSRIIGTAIKFQ